MLYILTFITAPANWTTDIMTNSGTVATDLMTILLPLFYILVGGLILYFLISAFKH